MTNKAGAPLEYIEKSSPDDDISFKDEYYIVSCMGCDTIAFLNIYGDETMFIPTGPDWYDREYIKDYNVYPEAPELENVRFNNKYDSLHQFNNIPFFIDNLRKEVITAFEKDMGLLCGMGIRMLVEAICKEKGIVQEQVEKNGKPVIKDGAPKMRNLTLFEKINILKDKNIIDEAQKQVLHQVREMGNDTAHEIKAHEVRILKQALHVVEFVLYNIYEMPNIKIDQVKP